MIEVMKRDGSIIPFDIKKISSAIDKAFQSVHLESDPSIIDGIALKVTADFQNKIVNHIVTVEQIQDSVENVLSRTGYTEVAKAYILYRKQRENIRKINEANQDYKNVIDSYLHNSDWRITENSMDNYSVGGLIFSNSGKITSSYWLDEIYDKEIAHLHNNGDIHIHDLDMLTGDSAGWSLEQLIEQGLEGVDGHINSRPAKHLFSLCNQIVNFLSIVQNEWAGAQSFIHFDTYLAPFVKADELSYREVAHCMENFIYGVNMPNRWGSQVPFSNIGIDWNVPEAFEDKHPIIQNQVQSFTYRDCQKEMEMIDKALLEILVEAKSNPEGFQFPIPTIRIHSKFKFDESENVRLLFQLASKYGICHFENDMYPRNTLEDAKTFTFDEDTLITKAGGYFGYGQNSGSIGTVTINLPRIAHNAQDENEFFEKLEHILDISARSLHVKRHVLTKLMERGLYPYTRRYIKNFNAHYSTIGIIGMEETCQYANWIHNTLLSDEGIGFANRIFDYLDEKLISYQKEYHELFNIEATPAEGVTYRFAKADADWLNGKLYYTNASNLSPNRTDDLFEALDNQVLFQNRYTGGTIFHVYLQHSLTNWKNCRNLVKTIVSQYQIPYFTITPAYSVCKEHGYLKGVQETCPICSEKTKIYSRVTGYYRCLDEWNDGKKQEYNDRIHFSVD